MNPEEWQLVRFLADRVRAGQPTELWPRHIEAVRDAWKHDRTRAEAQVVVDAYPEKFPDLKG